LDLEQHHQCLARTLRQLEASVQRLTQALAHEPVFVRVAADGSSSAAIGHVCDAYTQIDYAPDDEVNETRAFLGVVGVASHVLERARAVNRAKDELRAAVAPIARMRMRIPVKGDDGPTRAIPLVRVLLRRLQRSDLNLRAAYRRIPILATAPSSVRYTRALTRSVARKSIEEIANLLAIREGPAVAADRARLATLDWHAERHLALVQDHYANIRANIVYESLDRRGRGRVQMAAELPLLYPASRRSNPPLVRFPEPELESTPRMPRRHRTLYLEPEPFLTTLRVHRYRTR